MMYEHVYKGRRVKFHEAGATEDTFETGIMHQWFMCGTSVYMPYALIEKPNGSMVLVNYHDVTFEHPPQESLTDLFGDIFMGGHDE